MASAPAFPVEDLDPRNSHLPAKGGEEDDELDRVDVIGNDDEFGLLRLDHRNDVVKAVLGEDRLLGVLGGRLVALFFARLSLGKETRLLLLLGLGLVLVEQLEELSGGVLVECLGELGDGRGDLEADRAQRRVSSGSVQSSADTDLQSLVEYDLLPLQADVFGPFDKAGKVSLGRDVAACNYVRNSTADIFRLSKGSPMPKLLGLFSNRGFCVGFAVFLVPSGKHRQPNP